MFCRAFVFCLLTLVSSAYPADGAKPTVTYAEQQKPIFKLMQVEEGWKITRGGSNCVVGVIDTGFDFFHPALADSLKPGWFAPGFYHTDFHGMDSHGTLVASLITARVQEGQDGIWGLAPECSILTAAQGMPIHELFRMRSEFIAKNPGVTESEMWKKWQSDPATNSALRAIGNRWIEFVFGTLADGVRFLVDHNAKVINISENAETTALASMPALKKRVEDAFAYAKEKDVLIVIGAGNTDKRVTNYPGDADFVMVAGASTLADQRWSMKLSYGGTQVAQGSCYGPRLSVVAPVEKLVVAVPHEASFYTWNDTPAGKYIAPFNGAYEVIPWGATSSATAEVAALASLVRSLRPDLHATDVIHLIEEGADPIGSSGFHEETGYGRINFRRTLDLSVTFRTEQ